VVTLPGGPHPGQSYLDFLTQLTDMLHAALAS
jgi:hypothetical protein